MTIADTAPTYHCAGPSCPGLPYRASDIPHPASCARPVHDPLAVSDHCPDCGQSEPECVCADDLTGAEKLRRTVNWIDYQNETFLDRFTAVQLLELHGWALQHPELPEFADSWTEEQIAEALGQMMAPTEPEDLPEGLGGERVCP